MDANAAWNEALKQLELQMTRATFKSWLASAEFLEASGDTWRIGVKNDYAREWLEARLNETVARTVAGIWGKAVRLVYVVTPDPQPPLPLPPPFAAGEDEGGGEDGEYTFDGFAAPKSNFVKVPHALIDEVIPHVRPSVATLALVVFRRTVGVVVHADGSPQKEWVTTYRHLMIAAGINSVATARLAIWEARTMGLIIWREVIEPERRELIRQHELTGIQRHQVVFTLRPRWRGEPIDYPENGRFKR